MIHQFIILVINLLKVLIKNTLQLKEFYQRDLLQAIIKILVMEITRQLGINFLIILNAKLEDILNMLTVES